MAKQDAGAAVAHIYAEALYDVAAEAGLVSQVEEELLALQRLLAADEQVRRFLEIPTLPVADKQRAVRSAAAGLSKPVLHFLLVLIDHERVDLLGQIVTQFHGHANLKAGIAEFNLRSAVALQEPERAQLEQVLQRKMGRRISLRTTVEPDLLGGLVLGYADKQWDGSLVKRLEELMARLESTRDGAARLLAAD